MRAGQGSGSLLLAYDYICFYEIPFSGADTWGNITLEFSNDRKALLCYSHVDIFPNTAFISCSKGHMVIPESFYNPEKLQVIYGTPKVDAKKELIEHLYKDDPTQYNFGLSCAGLRYEADHVYDCIKNGKFFV